MLPVSQQSIFVLSSLGYHDYEGVALLEGEKPRLVRDLGDKSFLMLRNHGLLTVGSSIADAFLLMYIFESACTIQLRAQAAGTVRAPLRVVDGAGNVILEVDGDRAGPRLRLFDGSGRTWIALGGDAEGGILGVYARDEAEGAVLFADGGGGRLVLFEQGETRIALGTDTDGGRLGIFDAEGRLVYAQP